MMAQDDNSSQRKEQIIDAAATVFARHGLHRARIDDIVQAAGLSKGTFYWYFKSKEAVIFALMDRFFDQKLGDIRALVARSHQPADERLFEVVRLNIDTLYQARDLGLVPLIYDFYALSARDEAVQQFFLAKFQTMQEVCRPLFAQGIARGEFRPHDPDIAFNTLAALLEGLIVLWIIKPAVADLDQQVNQSLHLLLDGLKPG